MFGNKQKTELQTQDDFIESLVDDYKRSWNKGGIIEYKNERMAIVNKTAGKTVQYIIAMEILMSEGYKLEGVVSAMGNAGTNQIIFRKD